MQRPRTLVRLLIQFGVMLLLGVLPILLVAEPLTFLHKREVFLAGLDKLTYDRVINVIIGPLLAAAVIASVAFCARRIDKRPLSDLGVTLDRAWWRALAFGFAVGAFLMAFVFAIEYALGWITIAPGTINLALGYTLVKVLCVGTYEEFFARGYQLRNLIEGAGVPFAIFATSALFALLHLMNDNASAMSTLGLFVNGAMFAVAVLATGRLSAAIGLHIAWNLFQGAVFGFPVSGDKEPASLIAIAQSGPSLITGGDFGPEAGLIGVIASVLGIAVFYLRSRRTSAPMPTSAAPAAST